MITDDSRNEGKSQQDGGGIKKKRPRVGEAGRVANREIGVSRGNTNYRDNNSSDSQNRGGGYAPRRNYDNRNSGYSNDRGGGYSNDRSGGYSNDRRNYSNDNRGGGYSGGGDRGNYNNGNRYSDGGGERRSSGGYNNGNNRNYNNRGGNSYGGGGGQRPNNRQGQGNRNQRPGANVPRNGKVIQRVKQLIKPVKYKENIDPNTDIRLNKYLANAGVCSRREADAFITAGVVKVNGVVISELGAKVKRGDNVTFQEQPVCLESKVYVLLNKPKNCVTTSDDPQNRMTVMDLVKNACPERIYPVGRLDRNTTGVLLLTNDGDLASKLMHPKYLKKKIYQVRLDKDVAIEDMQAIADGIMLDDGEIHADSIAYVAEDVLNEVGIEIHSGRNRIVRRIFEKLGYQVLKLDRVYFAGLTKKNLPRGRWRYLTESEVNMLRMGAFE
ncbi:pseudouridine synthase [Dysgonomonas sp. 520]|uniref:pseudouridine synthase n=1 Tax=Dysgonomonas sp. 520 TaxID=2302931 RepID=UPI0013D3C212|nr:pseudouridine synthase [Dysgonomonas sp. 520]NDW10258.1 pseudouridine synthase [Dysgonomonas sp. 520]